VGARGPVTLASDPQKGMKFSKQPQKQWKDPKEQGVVGWEAEVGGALEARRSRPALAI
jgi:hypothetical protein